MTDSPRADFDSPWKEALDDYFQEFIAFFFPQIYADIDWNREYEFLDKELQQIVRDAEIGKRYADKLVKVWRKSGIEAWVLAHIEIQAQEETGFGERMFIYNYRLRDRYDRPVVSLAVLGDDRFNWRPSQYQNEFWGCAITFDFPIVKLLDYESRWDELVSSTNPFATVVMAHLKAKETRNNPLDRKLWKFTLTRQLYERGYDREDILKLYRFIDWLLALPEDLELELKQDLDRLQEQQTMPHVTGIERLGSAKVILVQLTRLFGELPSNLQSQVQSLSASQLDELALALLNFTSIEDVTNWLQANPTQQPPWNA
ncbi:DUF4351 domain-containing protein [Leptolyngbya sp. NIES-2104]|uniref:DUF4351 domain-containing protein n=1 Tax=Leptolyngbya sp. NIES-2104 TaxID=1552121 RepID=UPI00073EB4DD|nr:DUF4351 domain-containing protein [Leptolyngbya sp. NIES-2104]